MELTLEAKKVAVRAKWPKITAFEFHGHWVTMITPVDARHLTHSAPNEDAAWEIAFTRLSDSEKALVISCPHTEGILKCGAITGEHCFHEDTSDHSSHASRIERVRELEAGQNNMDAEDFPSESETREDALWHKNHSKPAEPAASAEGVKCECGHTHKDGEMHVTGEHEGEDVYCYCMKFQPVAQATEGEARDWEAKYRAEYKVVNRIWDMLGISTYEGARGLTIYELLEEKIESSRQAGAEIIEEAIYIAQQYRMAMGSTYISTEIPSAIEEMRRVDKHLAALATLPKKGA